MLSQMLKSFQVNNSLTDLREGGEEIHRVNLRTSSNASLQLNLARTRNLLPQQRHQQQQHEDDVDDGRGRWRPRRPEQDAWRRTARPVSAQSWYADAYPENVTYSRTEQVKFGAVPVQKAGIILKGEALVMSNGKRTGADCGIIMH